MYNLALALPLIDARADRSDALLPWAARKATLERVAQIKSARARRAKREQLLSRVERRAAKVLLTAPSNAAAVRDMLNAWDTFQADHKARFEERLQERREAAICCLPVVDASPSPAWQSLLNGLTVTE